VTAGLLTLTDLAAESGVPTPRLRRYAEAGLLPPARRDGDRLGYPPAEVNTARALFGSYTLVIDGTSLSLEVRIPGEAAGMLAAVVAAFGRLGYRDVRVPEGGKTDWAAAGLPFEDSRTAAGVMR